MQKKTKQELISEIKLLKKDLTKSHSLFENINVAMAVHEIITDKNNNPIDFIFLEANQAYEKLTKLKVSEIIGKRGLEVIPNLEKKWIKMYGKVALTGKSATIIDYSDYLNKYWEVKAFSPYKNQFAIVLTDITRRKQAEEKLQENEEKYRVAFTTSPDAHNINDMEGRYVDINKGFTRLTGYTRKDVIGVLSTKIRIWAIPEDREKLVEGLKQYQRVENLKSVFRCKDNSLKTALMSAHIINIQNKPHILSITRDISNQVKIEEALKESESEYRLLVESAAQPIFKISRVGMFEFMNGFASGMFGKKPEDLIGKNMWDLFPRKIADEQMKSIKMALDSGKLIRASRMSVIGGKQMWFAAQMQPVKNKKNKFESVMVILTDITSQKLAEEKLSATKGFLEAAIAQSPSGILIADAPDVNIRLANPAAFGIRGKTREVLTDIAMSQHSKNWQTFRLDGTPYPSEELPLSRAIVKGETIEDEELIIRDEKGTDHFVVSNAAPIYNVDEQIVAGIVVFHDISERKRIENKNKKLEEQLSQSQKMEAIGTLAGGIAHNFNNILMGIQGYTSLMKTDKKLFPANHVFINKIEEFVQNASTLTNQLLGFARSGKYAVKPIDLNDLIKNENQLFSHTKKEIKIEGKYTKNIWTVKADPGQIQQVLLNLYVNASQAMPKGGNIKVQTENVMIDEEYSKAFQISPGKYVKISVADTGIGMDKETQKRVFEPFFSTKDPAKSTGLGLASIYGIVTNHQGSIDVRSEKGKGTTFTIYLPSTEEKIIAEAKPAKKIVRGEGTILLVDDETMISSLSSQMLERLGYQVQIANSGKDALQIYKKNREQIDLVILDMIMPVMGGGETFEKLKTINPEINVLLSSGYSLNGQAEKILKKGCKGFLQKPFSMKDLSEKIRSIMSEK